MRLYSIIFLPALLFYFHEYSYLPLSFQKGEGSFPLTVHSRNGSLSTYVASIYDSKNRLQSKSFLDRDGNELGNIAYSYYDDNNNIKEKTYFANEKVKRKITFYYDSKNVIEKSIVEDNGLLLYVYYKTIKMTANSLQKEERWYRTESKQELIQLKRELYDLKDNKLVSVKYYKGTGNRKIQLIYYKSFYYNAANKKLSSISYYNSSNDLLRVAKYKYDDSTGILRTVFVYKDGVNFRHKALRYGYRAKAKNRVSLFYKVDKRYFPRFILAALGIGNLIDKPLEKEKTIVKKTEETKAPPPPVKVDLGKRTAQSDAYRSLFADFKEDITTNIYELAPYMLLVSLSPNLLTKVDLRDKKFVWKLEADDEIIVAPVVSGDSILFGTDDGTLYCANLDGKVLWKKDVGGFLEDTSLVTRANIVYMIDDDRKVLAFSIRNGKMLWDYNPRERYPDYVSSLFASEEYILLAIDNKIYTFDPNTGNVWIYVDKNKIVNQPIVRNEIIIACFENSITGFSIGRADIREIWTFAETTASSKPYFINDENMVGVYVITDQGYILKLNIVNGYIDWKTRINLTHNILISGNAKYLYINPLSDFFMVLDTKEGRIKGSYIATDTKTDKIITSIITSKYDDKILFYGTKSGKLFKIVYTILGDKN